MEDGIIKKLLEGIVLFVLPSKSTDYRSKFLQSNTLLYCVILFSALKIIATLASLNLPQNIFFADITKIVLENSINQARQSAGLTPLAENEKLNQAAQLKAQNMIQDKYFDHTSPSGVTPWFWFLKAGYIYKYAGENLAVGFYDSKEVYNAWLNSPTHKANILNPNYTEVGTAVLSGFGSGNTIIVVQEFGTRLQAKQTVATSVSPKPIITKQPATPAQTPNTTTKPTVNNNEKVLSQSTESQNYIEPASGKSANNLYLGVLNSVVYNYEGLLQNIIIGIFLIVICALLTLILFNFDRNLKKQLVFRASIIIVILFTATLINRGIIIALIPHQVLI